jgi:hypothetical protein
VQRLAFGVVTRMLSVLRICAAVLRDVTQLQPRAVTRINVGLCPQPTHICDVYRVKKGARLRARRQTVSRHP